MFSHTVLRTQQLSLSQALALQKLELTGNYDFWKESRPNRNADIMTHVDSLGHLTNFLKDRKIHHSVMVDDVEKYDKIMNMHPTSIERFKINFTFKYI